MRVQLHGRSGAEGAEFGRKSGRRRTLVVAVTTETGDSVGIELTIIEHYWRALVAFFESMAASVDGWPNSLFWRSEFSEVEIRATNQGNGVATPAISVARPPNYETEAEVSVELRSIDLTGLAGEMRELVGRA